MSDSVGAGVFGESTCEHCSRRFRRNSVERGASEHLDAASRTTVIQSAGRLEIDLSVAADMGRRRGKNSARGVNRHLDDVLDAFL